MVSKSCSKCEKCVYPIKKDKKYASYSQLLFDRNIANIITRGNTSLPYRDTQERLATLKAKVKYSRKIDKSGKAHCNPPWYYPTVNYCKPNSKSFY